MQLTLGTAYYIAPEVITGNYDKVIADKVISDKVVTDKVITNAVITEKVITHKVHILPSPR